MGDHGRYRVLKLSRSHAIFVMLGAEVGGRLARVRQFIGLARLGFRRPAGLVTDAEGFDALTAGDLAHHRQHGAGIEPAAEKDAERNF